MIEFRCAGRCPPRCLLSTGVGNSRLQRVPERAAARMTSFDSRSKQGRPNAFSASAALAVRSVLWPAEREMAAGGEDSEEACAR